MVADILTFQEAIQSSQCDAWALYDFRGSNSLAHTILGVSVNAHCTRRWMVVIPAQGNPVKIVHRMERDHLLHLPWHEHVYSTHEEWFDAVRTALAPYQTVAMEYSPNNAIPVVSKVDAGTVEMVRGLGHIVESSGTLAQRFTSVLTPHQLDGATQAGKQLRAIIHSAFAFIRECILADRTVSEYEVQQYILDAFQSHSMVTDSVPIVAIGKNASKPHYAPTADHSDLIQRDMVVLIDSWAKYDTEGSVFADLTWVGYTASQVPSNVDERFAVIAKARDAALQLVKDRFQEQGPVFGYEVDDACRAEVSRAGLSELFIHRTGHNITTEIHGPGVNMDNFETHDDREILPGMSFSIEPGVYESNSLGLRTEIDVLIRHDGSVHVPSEPLQHKVMPLLATDWKQ